MGKHVILIGKENERGRMYLYTKKKTLFFIPKGKCIGFVDKLLRYI